MNHIYIFGANALAELLYYYLTLEGIEIDGFVLNQQYIQNDNIPEMPKVLFPIEKAISEHGAKNIAVYVTVAYAKMNGVREVVYTWLREQGIEIRAYFHPTSVIAKNAWVGVGNIFLENSTVQPFVRIGNGNIFWNGVNISHHCRIGNFNYFSPGATMAGRVLIHNKCFLGTNCTVKNDIEIEDDVLVGAGAYAYRSLSKGSVFVPQRGIELERTSSEIVLN